MMKWSSLWITLLCCLSVTAIYGQPVLNRSGEVNYSGSYIDYLLPQQFVYPGIRFKLKGGDGGRVLVIPHMVIGEKSCLSYGGGGAIVEALFKLGTGTGQLHPGSTIRFIVGGKGQELTADEFYGASAASAGGGGTAVLYRQKGSDNWTILAVAGGGGGAYQGSALGSCQDGNPGGLGRTVAKGGNGDGSLSGSSGSNGQGGQGGGSIGDGDLSGGGGGATADGKGGSSMEGRAGAWTGGKGGSGRTDGGFGFGGGAAGDESGGGGGGYSGGGGGGMTGSGGGGGSYVHPDYALEQILLEYNREGKIGMDGFIEYEFTPYSISAALVPKGSAKDLHAEWMLDDADQDIDLLLRDYDKTDPTDNERWYYDNASRAFRLFDDPGKCLDAAQTGTNGAKVYLHSCNGKTNQRWTFGDYLIQLYDDPSKCLILRDDELEDGNTPTIWDCDTAPASRRSWLVLSHSYSPPESGEPSYADRDWYRFGLGKTVQLAGHDKCIDNRAGTTENGNNIQLYSCQEALLGTQSWVIDGTAFRLAASTNKCLDLSNSNTVDGTNIQLWNCNGTDAQNWIYDVANQAIRSVTDMDKCLDVYHSGTADGTNIQLWNCNGTNAQQWLIDGIPSTRPDSAYIHLAADSSKCIDVYHGTLDEFKNNANIQLWNCNETGSQFFRFEDGQIKVQAAKESPGKCVDATPTNFNVRLYDCNNLVNQQWIYDGINRAFRSKFYPGKCLDVYHSNFNAGTNIQVWECNGTDAQRFEIY